jgi:hypothetical protein
MARWLTGLAGVCVLAIAGWAWGTAAESARPTEARLFELRTYYVLPGRMDAMNARFRDHTCKLFQKHGMTIVGFWQPEGKDKDTKLIYILAHANRAAADASWKGFRDDPEWKAVREASEKDGKIVERVESVYMSATDYSPMK